MATSKDPDRFLDASAAALGLTIEPAWRPAVLTHLDITLRFVALLEGFPLPDDAEPAPVFVPMP